MIDNKKLTWLLIILILVIASFFRLWQLDSIPPGLYPDEAINATDAISALKTGDFKVFYPDNNGREGLYINIIALFFGVFGISMWSFKLVGALVGILTVLGLFLFTKEILNKNIALISSFLLAISFWHINFSRIGFRGILVPFVLVFGMYFLFRAFRTKKLSDFVLSGIFWGLGFHTYISFRVAILVLGTILILKFIEYLINNPIKENWKLWVRKKYIQDTWWKADCFLLVIILVALPIGIYFVQSPGDFIGRATGVSIFSTENPIIEFGKSFVVHLGMFNIYGDYNWRHNFAESPQLLWPVGIVFLIGIILSIKKLVASLKRKDYSLSIIYISLFAWFFALLLPGMLTYEGIPHALRIIGVIPVAYIFAGMGAWSVYQWINKKVSYKKMLILPLFLLIFSLTYAQFYKYFFSWAEEPEVRGSFSRDYVEMGNYLNSLPQETQKYVIVNEVGVQYYGLSIPAQVPIFIETAEFGETRAEYIPVEDLNKIKTDQKETVIIPLYNNGILEELQKHFQVVQPEEKQGFWAYKVK